MGLRVIQDRLFQESSKCHTLEEGLLLLVWRCRSSELGIKRVPDPIRSSLVGLMCSSSPRPPKTSYRESRAASRGISEREWTSRPGQERAPPSWFLPVCQLQYHVAVCSSHLLHHAPCHRCGQAGSIQWPVLLGRGSFINMLQYLHFGRRSHVCLYSLYWLNSAQIHQFFPHFLAGNRNGEHLMGPRVLRGNLWLWGCSWSRERLRRVIREKWIKKHRICIILILI